MSNPLALLPLALAAGGGSVDGMEAQQLVAAGLTLLQRSAPLVRALAGRRSALLLPTAPSFLVALAASDGHGAVLINPLAAPAEIAFQCEDAGVGAVFTTSALASRLPTGLPIVLLDDAPRSARVIAGDRVQEVDLGSHHGLALAGERDVDGRDEEAAIVYTSAMAGTALGAVLTHRNLLANARSTVSALAMTANDHVLALLPWSHLFGLTVTASAPLLLGARVTTLARFHPARAAELLAGDATVVVAVPAVYHALLKGLERQGSRRPLGALRLCVCGGAVLPVSLQDAWYEATGIELRQGYGLTEAAPVCLFNRVDRPNVRGTLGYPFPGVEVAVMRPAQYEPTVAAARPVQLPAGEAGEICVRGENVFGRYVRGDTDGLPRRDGWLFTGDEGVVNADGTVSFLRLIKPMFTRSGFNVYPREVERVVGEMAGVTAVQVVAVPHPLKEHDLLLRVTGEVTEAAVRAWCEARLSAYKQPAVVEVVAPLTPPE